MIPRINKSDLRVISHYLGILIMLFGAIMLAPLLVSLLYGEWDIVCNYALGIGISLTVGSVLRLAKIDPQRMNHKHAIAITGTIWIIGAVLAAIPLSLSGHYASFLDAVFEGVSGLTATGLSLVQDIDHLSMGDNMWRFTMQFVGGQGVIVVAISLGIFARTGSSLYSTEGRDDSILPNVMNTARFIWKFAIAAVVLGTIILSIILFFGGMDPGRGIFHALWITIGAYDTGGFAAGSLSLISYHSWPLEVVAILLMMFGALSFALVAQIQKGNWREFVRDIEVRTLALWTAGMLAVFVAALGAGEFLSDFMSMIRRGIFTIVSATTNTGFQVLTNSQINTLLSSGAFFLVAVAMGVGGSSASTAGGIKALRVGLIFKGITLQVRKMLQPRSAQITTHYNHIGKHQLSSEMLSAAMVIAALYMVSYIIGALVGIAYGYEALDAIFESISAGSNAGLSSGIITSGMPVPLEVLYILQMWLGRLEFITLLGLFATLIMSVLPSRRPKGHTTYLNEEWLRDKAANIRGRHEARISRRRNEDDKLRQEEAEKSKQDKTAADEQQKNTLNKQSSIAAGEQDKDNTDKQGNPSFNTQDKESPDEYRKSDKDEQDKQTKGSTQPGTIGLLAALLAFILVLTLAFSPMRMAHAESGSSQDSGSEVSLGELAEIQEHLDGTRVQFSGEVVGSIMHADAGHVWVTLSDGSYGMSVYLPEELQDGIVHTGSYAYEGSTITVKGEYHTGCTEHEGLNDVHVTKIVQVVDEGGQTEHSVDYTPLVAALILAGIAGLLSLLYRYLSQRQR